MNHDTAHVWWSRLRHQGLLLSPVVMLDRYPAEPSPPPFYVTRKLKDAYTRFAATLDSSRTDVEIDQNAVLGFIDVLLESYVGQDGRLARQHHIPEKLTAAARIGSRTETLRPHRVVFADATCTTPALLVVADSSPHVGRGRGRNTYARFLELLRGTGHRLGLLTNGLQVRLVYAGLDFESWCEWETERWFDEGEGTQELAGLRQLLSPDSLKLSETGLPGLLDAVEESRKKQADLSSVLRENVRQAIELLLEEVSAANRTDNELFHLLVTFRDKQLSDAEAQEALLQASVRVVMRMVVCLFAESRRLLPVDDPVYARSYGVRTLYELLDEAVRDEGGDYGLRNRQMAWPRLMALFRLIYSGSAHGSFVMRPYGGALFRPGTDDHDDAVLRALSILEHKVPVRDVTVYHVLRKLLRGPLPVVRGRSKTFVEGPVDYTDLRTEFIGLIYEGLLDYRLKRTDERTGPQIFLNIGREPVLPLYRLEDMLANDLKGLKDLLTTLRKEKVTATAGADEEEPEEKEEDSAEVVEGEEEPAEVAVEDSGTLEKVDRTQGYLDADARARKWAREAAILAGLAPKKRKKEPEPEYQARVDAEANRLIKRVVPHGEFYLVRAGNTRKGTGTFYTRPQLAVPTVHRTLQPLCYEMGVGDSGLGIGGPGTGQGDAHGGQLPRSGGVAEGDGPGRAGLHAHGGVPEGGEIRPDAAAPGRGGVGAVQHLGGTRPSHHGGVPQSSVDRAGLADGNPDPGGDQQPSGVPLDRPDGGTAPEGHLGSAPVERAHDGPGTQALTPVPNPQTRLPKRPEVILGLKVCDPACGSASFLVAALHYLTDALYESLKAHCNIEDPNAAKRITLPYGHPRKGKAEEEIVPFPPDDPQRGDQFAERIKALLRRHVVERCIYGVDINPLAVEFARVSLWIETLDTELPFTFLDHKIKVGNSLVGCWLDRVLDYPIRAWERDGGDGKDGERTARIETFLKGEPDERGRRSGDGQIKKEMRQVIESRFTNQPQLFEDTRTNALDVVAQARASYERLHEMPLVDADAREAAYRRLDTDPTVQRLRQAMNEWCAVWFWPMDEESARHVPTPLTFHSVDGGRRIVDGGSGGPSTNHQPQATKHAILNRLRHELKFFHWEIEFPDVFAPEHGGFDAAIGNPPWDVIKPNSQEFFTEYDPLYRTYDKQAALRRQRAMFASEPAIVRRWTEYVGQFKALGNFARCVSEPFEMTLARGRDGAALSATWAAHRARQSRVQPPTTSHQPPFRLQGSADLNSYKLFAETFWNLLNTDGGRLGVLLPTGLYSDFGTRDLREELLLRGQLELLYAFQNEKRAFAAAHHSFKQTIVIATRGGGPTPAFLARFRMGVGDSPHAQEMEADLLRHDHLAMRFTIEDVRLNSPKTLSLVELRSPRDAEIFRKIYARSVRLGDNAPGWEVEYAREFDMTNDSKLFPPREQWEAKGYKPDVFGRWIGPDGDVALPLYEGRMIGPFDCIAIEWQRGHGSAAVWMDSPSDHKRLSPRALMASNDAEERVRPGEIRVLFRDIARNTDTRTLISAPLSTFPCGHTISVLRGRIGHHSNALVFSPILNSFCYDFVLRLRSQGTHQSWYIIEETPLPVTTEGSLALQTARLSFIHRRFAPEWLRLKHLYPQLDEREWKHWWAVTEADRLRLRVEIDALCADLYGLEPDDFDWIVRDDPTDPKGFYRVDRDLPFRERLTGLAAAAFRALKNGDWGVEVGDSGRTPDASKLSNDEFFEIIGIPELTSEKAAKAMGLGAPLIRKREGCHAWHPERFTGDDPRYGWTWEHCRQDAIALLGSEEAVEAYINPKPPEPHDGEEQVQESRGKKSKRGAKGKPREPFQLRSEETQPRLSTDW